MTVHADYAKKHGYDFIVDFEQNAEMGPMWHKFEMIEAAIHSKKYDWIWWMDLPSMGLIVAMSTHGGRL